MAETSNQNQNTNQDQGTKIENNNNVGQNGQQNQQIQQQQIQQNQQTSQQIQIDINQITQQAAQAAVNGVMGMFGFNSPEQAKGFGTFMQMFSGVQNNSQQNQNNAQQQQQQQQNDENLSLKAQLEAMKACAKPEKVDNIVVLAMARNKTNVSEAIKDIKKEQPDWFTDTTSGSVSNTGTTGEHNTQQTQNKNKGTGNATSGTTSGANNQNDLGKRLAEQKKKTTVKAKYFLS